MSIKNLSLFFYVKEVKAIEQIAVVELFGGIGAIRKALINQEIPYKVIDYIEIDKNCVKSYNQLYGEDYKPQSVMDYHPPNEKIDILMHGSPCQDFSRIGMKRGGEVGSGTRSSLLFETIRIIKEMKEKPTWVIWENVKGVLDRNMRDSFFYYLEELEELGYQNKFEILNAMDFGVAQKRERIFVVSGLEDNIFQFENLEKRQSSSIKEILEADVSEKYLVQQPSMLKLMDANNDYRRDFKARVQIIDDFAYTISTKQMRIPNAGLVDLGNGTYRYLTEKECFLLMGFSDEDFKRLRKIYPDKEKTTSSILYKQAGNSIVVPVLESILKEIVKGEENESIKQD